MSPASDHQPDSEEERRQDAEWVRRAKEGDRDAARCLCEKYYPRAQIKVRRARPKDADDICQSAVLVWLRKIRAGELKDESRPGKYLFGVCKWMITKRPRQMEPLDDFERYALDTKSDPAREAESRIQMGHVLQAMKTLLETDQEVIGLRLFDEFTHAEIAERLGCSENVSKKKFQRARKRLLEALSEI